jgi:predicted metal-dependent enzyme (double-stranded beta helix superfamily)
MTITEVRSRAVAMAVARAREAEREEGVSQAALGRIKQGLLDLAAEKHLFPFSDFPPSKSGDSILYRLSEDQDHRFALYLSSAWPGKGTVPHNHTTWAVIVAIAGEEHNRLYERVDDGSVPGRGEVRQTSAFVVRPGTGISFLPDEIHSIHVMGDEPTLHLHMYGRGLEQLTERIGFDVENGTYRVFPPHRDIR